MTAQPTALRRWTFRIVPAVVLIAASYGMLRSKRAPVNVPTADVVRGEFIDYSQLRGEIEAGKSVVLSAPSNVGDLQIIQLAKNGAAVKKGEVVVQFDPTDLTQRLQQSQTELKQAEAQIEQTRAQGRLKQEQDTTNVAKSKFDVERARLDASKQEILSAIDGEKSKLALADAEQKQKQLEQQLASDGIGSDADVNSRKLRRDKANFDFQRRQKNIRSMQLIAPVEGMVTLKQNFRAGSPFGGAPEWHVGDRAFSGAAIIELPDLTTLRVNAQVDETERGRIKPGQQVSIRVDAAPDREFKGTVVDISPLTKPDFSTFPPTKNFAMTVKLDSSDARLRPGMSASLRVAVEKVADSLILPAEAIFQKSGRSVAYVLRNGNYEERTLTVTRRGSGQVVVSGGVNAGDKVATRDPLAEVQPR
jgi:RND family efflux transporter MFP subunit